MKELSKRNDLLKYAILHRFSYNKTQTLLNVHQQPLLYVRYRRDSIIAYGLLHGMDIAEINRLLKKYNLTIIS